MCRCCMLRPPDKNLKASYTSLGKSEVYADMLKDCFEIHMLVSDVEGDGGICEVCITRLRDACDFKQQVQRCLKNIQLQATLMLKDEIATKVKLELSEEDDDNGIYFLDVKEEMSDYEHLRDDDDEEEKNLAEMLGFNDITVKRKHVEQKNSSSKKRAIMADTSIEKKAKKISTGPLKISIRALSEMNKIIKPAKVLPNIRFINDSMKHKLNIDNILKYSNCTPFSNKTLAGIVCAYCKETFQKIEELRNHTRENHNGVDLIDKKRMDKNNLSVKMDITDLKCSTCMASFDVITNLKKHLSKEHDVKFYSDVHDYILEFKLTDSEMLNCALCNSTFETFKMLLQHMNGHYRNYICEVCDLGFINKHRLKNHQRTHEIGSFNCTFCDKVFSTRVRKMCHEKYTHNSGARYTTNCPHCDQSFTSYYQRNRHMFKEHNMVAASYKCNICDKSFILKSKLTAHIKKVHLMERNHICAECGQGFFIKQSLDEHMIKHNGERVFKCTVCPKAYARKKTLREHMRIHNNDRRFKCGICALAFVQKCSLKSHMLSNHGITLAEYETSRSDLCSPESL
ncbi:hypothetical protein O3G_MSEX011869 [Manduca sexta]|uniref:Uncharacterized protein n=3 Tax=Manduca sexta TaxID=7130 RepID=A0A921ZLZ5_MANSE|nr:hypothetical protein O3G_MSEX011869 [Manduca sexta]